MNDYRSFATNPIPFSLISFTFFHLFLIWILITNLVCHNHPTAGHLEISTTKQISTIFLIQPHSNVYAMGKVQADSLTEYSINNTFWLGCWQSLAPLWNPWAEPPLSSFLSTSTLSPPLSPCLYEGAPLPTPILPQQPRVPLSWVISPPQDQGAPLTMMPDEAIFCYISSWSLGSIFHPQFLFPTIRRELQSLLLVFVVCGVMVHYSVIFKCICN